MLVGTKVTDDPDVSLIAGRLRGVDEAFGRLTGRLSLQYLFYPSSLTLLRHPWLRESDVVQLYNTHGGYFSHTVLPLVGRRRPVVWRLSDMWPMTGHCAYSFDCERWKTGCGSCPILSDKPELYRDTTAALWRVKRWAYARTRLAVVAPSHWMEGLARESPLLNPFPVHFIPNGLDAERFRPIPKTEARASLGLPASARVVLFSAESIADPRKGADVLHQALERVAEAGRVSNVVLLVAGRGAQSWQSSLPFEVVRFGEVRDDERLATLYSAADVFVLPTLAENLPNGILESMACATPPISFDVGGCPDAVRHMETGYLARYRDPEDLARGVELLLSDEELRQRLGRRSREVVLAEYTQELQARRFKHLYEELLARRDAEERGHVASAQHAPGESAPN